MKKYDIIIIGAGAAALSAGIYATRYNLKTLVIGKEMGGQIGEASKVENYPGFLDIPGLDLAQKFKEHAELLGCEVMLFPEITEVKKKGKSFVVKTDKNESFEALAVIIATGSKKRRLGIPGEKELAGRGISYCATCDAPFFRDKVVAVAGGGDAALMGAMTIAEYAKKVYVIYRRMKKDMPAMPSWVKKAEKCKKLEMIFNAVPTEVLGDGKVEKIRLGRGIYEDKTLLLEEMEVDGLFIEIGSDPATELATKAGAKIDEKGHVMVGPDMSTAVEGLFAAGDVTNASDGFEQLLTAGAEGALAARSAYYYVLNFRK